MANAYDPVPVRHVCMGQKCPCPPDPTPLLYGKSGITLKFTDSKFANPHRLEVILCQDHLHNKHGHLTDQPDKFYQVVMILPKN